MRNEGGVRGTSDNRATRLRLQRSGGSLDPGWHQLITLAPRPQHRTPDPLQRAPQIGIAQQRQPALHGAQCRLTVPKEPLPQRAQFIARAVAAARFAPSPLPT